MTIMNLRKVGGSVAVVIPPQFLDSLRLSAGSPVELSLKNNQLQITPILPTPKYTLAQLLAGLDYDNLSADEKNSAWLDDTAVGRELL